MNRTQHLDQTRYLFVTNDGLSGMGVLSSPTTRGGYCPMGSNATEPP